MYGCRIYNAAVLPDCDPPFKATPDCYTVVCHNIITSQECALSYSCLFNISDASPLVSVAAAVNKIQSMCDAITTEVQPRPVVLHAPACTAVTSRSNRVVHSDLETVCFWYACMRQQMSVHASFCDKNYCHVPIRFHL